ncbi:aspartyl protease family protein [Marinoscillum furvescens]|uniref:Aspartyl protease n=1 Tax=Marinoscillum furvescens DSM 4134 TaxID=1122208 RepID=A0A3D9L567_MARFU|nr:aspartyl protease family protein [Marinoscillum furvescens]REE00396.1 aspartyl protease [Marinoscillum furvescens DSM 4134]
MLKKFRWYWLICWGTVLSLALSYTAHAQGSIGFVLPPDRKMVEVPFEEYSNLIVVPVTINNFLTLKFILDTGAESAILTEKLFGDILGLQYVRDITIQAPGVQDSLQAYVATGLHLALPGGIQGRSINMLVLKHDYLELNKNLGEEIYGILGYDLFNRFVVNVDYDDKVIRFYRPEHYKPKRSAQEIPLEVTNTKPFVQMTVSQKDRTDSVKLMVDTGASHALLLDVRNMNDIAFPEKLLTSRLGQGLGGEIPGFLGRMSECSIGGYEFDEVLSSIPIDGAYIKAIKRGSRHGTIGGDLLTRFNVTFDYPNQKLYLKRSNRFHDEFDFDMSGITLGAVGKKLDSLVVRRIQDETPAADAGILPGDVVLKVNGLNLRNATMGEITDLLRKKDGFKVRIVIWREGKKEKKVFRLRRMI